MVSSKKNSSCKKDCDCQCKKQLCCFNKTFSSSPVNFINAQPIIVFPPPPAEPFFEDTNPAKVPNIFSYFNAQTDLPLFQTSINPKGIFSGWCLDPYSRLVEDHPRSIAISILDPQAKTEFLTNFNSCSGEFPKTPLIETYFESVIYIFNEAARYENILKFSKGDIQAAIWTILFSTKPLEIIIKTELVNVTDANVFTIIREAMCAQKKWNKSHDSCKYLLTNGIAGLLLLPQNSPNQCAQIVAIQVKLCELDLSYCSTNCCSI